VTECVACGRRLLSKAEITKAGQDVWKALKGEGYRQRCTTNPPLCNPCYLRGGADRKTWKLSEFVEEVRFMIEAGQSSHETARKLGVKHVALLDNLRRARRRGLTTWRVPSDRR
jgi:hypothetical protein